MAATLKSRRTESDDGAITDAELLKLQRQYRSAEGGRKAYADETTGQLRKQAALIEKLEKDHSYLTEELAMAEGSAADLKKNVDRARDLEARLEGYNAEIAAEKQRCAELDKLILTANKELRDARLASKSAAAAGDKEASERKILTMENRVEKANKKLGTALAVNGKLRGTLEHLRQERLVFANIHAKLEKQLVTQKREMALVVERSNQAYEQRDDINTRMAALKERAEKETAQYDNEIKELTRALEHDRKLKSFMGVKGQDRGKEGAAAAKKREAASKDRTPEETLKVYEQAFRKIKDSTGIEDLNKLVDRFIEVEDHNFSLYNFVNELNREIETLREQVQSLQGQIESATAENEAGDARRKIKLHDLEKKLAATETEATQFEEQLAARQSEFAELQSAVSALYTQIGCDPAAVADVLGSAGVTESNIMQYMRVIEDRTNHLLRMRGLLDAHAADEWERKEVELRDQVQGHFDPSATLGPKPKPQSLLGQGPGATQRLAAVAAPSAIAEDDSDDLDEPDSAPLTLSEQKAKALKNAAKPPTTSGSLSRGNSAVSSRRFAATKRK